MLFYYGEVPPMTENKKIYTVSRLNRAAKSMLESNLGLLWLSGEISNLTLAVSGHWYFTLKDHNAQIKCAMFKGHNKKTSFTPKYGQQILAHGILSIYESRGDYQLIVESMQLAGTGLLKEQFEAVKCQLASQGYFDEKHKKVLPKNINIVGVITSSTGAALHDILSVLKRRDPRLQVIIYPTQVQGKESAKSLATQIKIANTRNECDLLIVGRGGGSLEDLWCFNEIIVADAIFKSRLPIISAVGHEIDVSISDLVADLRAATPSAAAEIVSPSKEMLETKLVLMPESLKKAMQLKIQLAVYQLALLNEQLLNQDPNHKLQQQHQYLDEQTLRLQHAINNILNNKSHQYNAVQAILVQRCPTLAIQIYDQQLAQLKHNLTQAIFQKLKQNKNNLQTSLAKLNGVSPLATLARGYAIVKDDKQNVVTNTDALNIGDPLEIRLSKGQITAVVSELISI